MYRAYLQELNRMASSKASSKLKAILFLGTVRENRVGLRVARFMKKQLEKRNYEVEMFDPLEMKFPMLHKPVHFYGPERKGCPQWLLDAENKVKAADAFIVVSGEYNHSIPPALSNMLDHFPGSIFSYKPSAIVCYSPGIYGGMRAAMALRPLLSEIGTLSVSNIFGIPEVHKALDEEGAPKNDHMEKGAGKLLDQLDWYATAMKNHRNTAGVPQ
ncbi:NADH-dependent flavin reductase subunit 2-like [Mytilus californianus]|uniref:NADH-dependent flavin reductase subunit 2-like n=1 Tax=Mytilus californianus TaxID=6549 RepID=UPI0022461F23|nr:NADH-dependent flavin reductase subunit 2-like [Mytilus californianus]